MTLRRYAAKENRSRILTLDILRGFFLVVIAVDHFQRFPSLWDIFTGRGMLWVSAAEGFFIISGIVVGYIYGPKMLASAKKTTIKIWKRALLLYGLTVGFTLVFTIVARQLQNSQGVKPGASLDAWTTVIADAVKLQYVYGWIDFLALYAVFMAVAPLAIYLTVKHKGLLVVALSVAVWAFLRGVDVRFGWQVFFMPAIVLGYYLPTIETRIASIAVAKQRKLYAILVAVVFAMLAFSTYFVFVVPFVASRAGLVASVPHFIESIITVSSEWYVRWLEPQFYKWTLPLPRIVFAWVWFITMYLVVRHFERQIVTYTKDFFTVLGKNSLFTYCFMGILLFGAHFIFVPTITRFNLVDALANTVITALFLAIIYGAAKYKDAIAGHVARLYKTPMGRKR